LSDGNGNWAFVVGPKGLADPTKLDTTSDGAGPYEIDPAHSVTGDHYTLSPNPYYYDKPAIRFSGVVLKEINVPSTMLEALKTGQIDVAEGDPTTAAQAKASGLNVTSAPARVTLVFFDAKHAPSSPIADLRVRQAINHAVDRNAIVRAAFGGQGSATSTMLLTDADTSSFQNYYSYSPQTARALLAAAGYPHGFSLKLIAPTGPFQLVMQVVASELNAIGIHTKLTVSSNYVPDVLSGKYPVFIADAGITLTEIEYNLYLNPAGSAYFLGPADPIVSRLYEQGLQSRDPAVYWTKMWKRVVTDADFVPINIEPQFYYSATSIGGVLADAARSAAIPTEWYPKAK
ncbi:MAG TPA: ABC transporter substrate-binding protein, partial [Chloroflexota bacterium]